MSLNHKLLWAVAVVLACGASRETTAAADARPTGATNLSSQLKFRPPVSGAPSVRVTGGSRGSGDTAISLDVLAPADVGLTTRGQPSLYWFQSKPTDAKFELTLLQPNTLDPLLRVTAERSSKAGIQRMQLSDHHVTLAPGVEYQWVVALINDPDNRSTDLVASGAIKRVEPSGDLKEKIGKATPASLASVYAEAGIWYDALSVLSDQIEAQPEHQGLRESRADLLHQIGLKAAAGYEVGLTKN